MKKFIPRHIGPIVCQAIAEFPVLVLTRPSQSGTTTLLKQMFGHDTISLEPPDARQAAMTDPRGFLEMYPVSVFSMKCNMRQISDLKQFQTFLRALAARNARLLNLSDLARDLG